MMNKKTIIKEDNIDTGYLIQKHNNLKMLIKILRLLFQWVYIKITTF